MSSYTRITVIYNPKSTGPGEKLSKEFEAELKQAMPKQSIVCLPTKHKGHAKEIAYKAALATERPLIISASGDGGYNEVVNGVMEAQHEHPKARPTTGLLAAGNANDHFQTLHQDDLIHLIKTNREQEIDVLKITITTPKETTIRYAHSYAGLGLTPQVGLELNKTKLNKFNEFFVAAKALLLLRPVQLSIDDHTHRYSSLIFSNIDRMAKYLTLSKNSSITDGKFEVVAFGAMNRIKLLATLLKASTVGLDDNDHKSSFTFTTLHATKLQVDGEIVELKAKSHLTISSEHRTLRCIV